MSKKQKDKFSFWPSDWLGGTTGMTAAERGVYIDLLCCQWQRGPMQEAQALLAGRAEPELVRQVLAEKFHRNPDGSWQNNRLEQERKRKASQTRAKAPRIDSGERLMVSLLEGLETGLMAYRPAEPPLLVFPCRGEPSSWGLSAEQVDKWQQLYEGLDVLAEARKALAWVEANGSKTAGGMTRFLVTWLNRATNSSGGGKARPESKTFRQVDADAKRRMLIKLKLEQTGLNHRDAERLSNLDEDSAMAEAKRLLGQTQFIAQEEIPW